MTRTPDERERGLFDHAIDPGAWYNLASDPAYTKIVQALSLWLR